MREFFRRLFRPEARALMPADMPWLAGGAMTDAGVAVSTETALRVPAVSAAVRAISEAAMTLPARVVRKLPGEAPVDLVDHPVAGLVSGGVNEWTGWAPFVRDLVIAALCCDEGGLAWVNRVGGRVREVIPYRRGLIAVEYLDTGEPRYHVNGRAAPIGDVVHVRAPFGRAPLSLAREAIGRVAVMQHHASKLFANGARPGGVLAVPGKLSAETAARMAKSWNDALRGDNVGKTAVLEEGTKFEQMAFNSVDSQFAELRTFELQEIARAFRVPPHIIFDLGRATWSNSEQLGLEFLTYALEPWLQVLEDALRRALFDEVERPTHFVLFDRDDLTRADLGARAAAYSSLIAARVINPNEARAWEGLPPYAGGNEFANPNITLAPPAPAGE